MKIDVKRIAMAALLLLASACAQQPLAPVPGDVAYVTSQGGGVTVLDTTTLKPLAQINVGPGPRGIAITPDGKQAVSGSYDNTLKVWDIESGKLIRTLEGHAGGSGP